MSERNDGGQAFPNSKEDPWGKAVVRGGMSLRDYFAASAMQGLLSGQAGVPCEDCMSEKHVAAIAYNQADKMIAERENDTTPPTAGEG